jgi:hypothetical protein
MKCNVNTNEEGNYHFPFDFTAHPWHNIDNSPSQMDMISICLQGFDFLQDIGIIIMENKNCTTISKVFVYKTKYLHIIFEMMILKWDNYGWFGDKNWQVGRNFSNEESRLPTSKILQCGWQLINIMQKKPNLVKCT